MNRHIIIAVVVVSGSGIVNAFMNKKPLTPIIIGSYVFFLVLALMDTMGGDMSKLAGALAMIAMVYVLLTEVPWTQIIALVHGTGSAVAGGAKAPDVIQSGSTASH